MRRVCDLCENPAWMEFSGREWNTRGWILVHKNLCPLHAREWLRERRKNNKLAKAGV